MNTQKDESTGNSPMQVSLAACPTDWDRPWFEIQLTAKLLTIVTWTVP